MLKDFIWGPVGRKRAMHACCFRKTSYFCSMHGVLSADTPQVLVIAFISGINGKQPLACPLTGKGKRTAERL
jgi:hypothetical protein